MQMEWNFLLLPRNATESSSFAISSRGVSRITLAGGKGSTPSRPLFVGDHASSYTSSSLALPLPDSDDVTYRVSYDRCSGREVEKRSYVLDTQLSGLYSHGQDITFRLPSDLRGPSPPLSPLPVRPPFTAAAFVRARRSPARARRRGNLPLKTAWPSPTKRYACTA